MEHHTFYLDTEFNGHGGKLISMALVSPVGINWYQATGHIEGHQIDPWVKEHVIPVLGVMPIPPGLFRESFHAFIQPYHNPHIICDWHADAAHFCDMLAGADYGSSLDFACRISILKTPPGVPISATPHNALADATALMQ